MQWGAADWEAAWAPYDLETYEAVQQQVGPGDVVLDIGAGDLRLARQLALRARRVYALEQQASLVANALPVPPNCQAIVADARSYPFPADVTVAVLLMRHCTHFALYLSKLLHTACTRLITNARWGMGLETITVPPPSRAFEKLELGWYACRCGATGFRPGPPAKITEQVLDTIWEVQDCPACQHGTC